jgi:hypothetical protein
LVGTLAIFAWWELTALIFPFSLTAATLFLYSCSPPVLPFFLEEKKTIIESIKMEDVPG